MGIKAVILLFLSISVVVVAQPTVGFGCFGFVGGFAGYTVGSYNATGLNRYIDNFNSDKNDSLNHKVGNFGTSTGYIVGVNFLRQSVAGFMMTCKGSYESLSEKNDAGVTSSNGVNQYLFEMKINRFGLGVELGADLTKSFSWKVVNAQIVYSTAKFTSTSSTQNSGSNKERYSEKDGNLGYNLGTGFIFYLIDKYVSIEGEIGYSFFSIPSMITTEGAEFQNYKQNTRVTDFISSGGVTGLVKLNIGFPL